jgi:anti-anti-sigma factor
MQAVPLELEQVGEVTVVHITDRRLLDEDTVDRLRRGLLGLADDPGRARMLLDFGAVASLSSAVLGVLLALRKSLLEQGGRLALCRVRPDLCEVFAVAGVTRLLNVYDAESEALVSFERR